MAEGETPVWLRSGPENKNWKITTEVWRVDDEGNPVEKYAQVGHTVGAPSFAAALPLFNEKLNVQWQQVAQMGAQGLLDQDPTNTSPEETGSTQEEAHEDERKDSHG